MYFWWWPFVPLLTLSIFGVRGTAAVPSSRCLMYLTGQHYEDIPPRHELNEVTHVALAFMRSDLFLSPDRTDWPLFTSVDHVRASFPRDTKVLIAIGGWGDEHGFTTAAKDRESRLAFADNVARMVSHTSADGVDIDWEYPGGNGESYRVVPNEDKVWEIAAYPLLLSQLRDSLGPDKIISAAVPGMPRDMIAFTSDTVPLIMKTVDFLNVMTYDLVNRRDNFTNHHSSATGSLATLDAYIERGASPQQLNLGFAFTVKWVRTKPGISCKDRAIGCPMTLGEDPQTGEDLGQTGAFSWHDEVSPELAVSFEKALRDGEYDQERGGYWYWDEGENLFWTFDTPEAISRKFPLVLDKKEVGGVFAWGLGEDAPAFRHFEAVSDEVARRKTSKDEL